MAIRAARPEHPHPFSTELSPDIGNNPTYILRGGPMTPLPNSGKAAKHGRVPKSGREVAMPKFLARVVLNAEGVRLLRQDKGSGRRAAVTTIGRGSGRQGRSLLFRLWPRRHDHHCRLSRRGVGDRHVPRGQFHGRRARQHDAAHHGRGDGPRSRQGGDTALTRAGTLTHKAPFSESSWPSFDGAFSLDLCRASFAT
jgi:hypothetical protein